MESRMRDVRRLSEGAPTRDLGAGERWGAHPAVLHLDIDAFFASVEQLRDPHLRGRPVVVGSGVAASASYEARAFGIRAGTPLHEVRRLCPRAVLLPGHAPTYRAFAGRVFSLAAELSPALELRLDDALIELTGTECLHGHLVRAAARLKRRILEETGLRVSMGLGTNRMIARMLTRLAKPDGFAWLRPGGEFAFVGRRPIEELPGVGPHRAAILREMGITRIEELRDLPTEHLRDLFGDQGVIFAARARGRETRAIDADELPHSIRRETSFDEPQTDAIALHAMLHYLLERAAGQARKLGAEPRALRVHLRWADGRGLARREAVDAPGSVTAPLFEQAERILANLQTRRVGIRNLGVELSGLRLARRAQLDLFEEAPESFSWQESARRQGAMTEEAPDAAPSRATGAGWQTRVAAEMDTAGETAACAGEMRERTWLPLGRQRQERLDAVVDRVREQFGFRSLVRGPSIELLDRLPADAYGFVLRTPCLTR